MEIPIKKILLSKLITIPIIYLIISFIRFDITWIPECINQLSEMTVSKRKGIVYMYFVYEVIYALIITLIDDSV